MFDGDIYYKPSVTSKPLRLTATDQEQHVVNGLSDWTYEGRTYSSPHEDCFTLRTECKNLENQVDNNNKYQVHALRMTLTTYTVFQNRGSALDICRPLVVYGRGPAGVPHHQQLCHACDGNTALLRWSLPLQCCLPLPQGKKWHQRRLKSAATPGAL